MDLYPRILEVFLYASALYLFARKQERVILYLPMLLFTRNLIEEFFLRNLLWYLLVFMFLVFAAYRVHILKKLNLFAVALLVYFTILYIFSSNLADTRPYYFAMFCMITAFAVIPNLYHKYGREVIFKDLYKMSLVIMLLFIVNTTLSTVTGYSPYQIYGRSTGVLYGAMGPTTFMILPLALFIFLLGNIQRVNLFNVAIVLATFALVLLSFRRTVQASSILAILAFLFLLFVYGSKKQVIFSGLFFGIASVIVLAFTGFAEQFSARYESRFADRELVGMEEGRFKDHTAVYEDIFVHERYSLLFGHSFFNSAGNYAGGIAGDRPLHPDIPVLVHASGLVGLGLYMGMVGTGFWRSWQASRRMDDKVVWVFCLAVFAIFTFSGRLTEMSYTMGFVPLLFLPLAKREVPAEEAVDLEPVPEPLTDPAFAGEISLNR